MAGKLTNTKTTITKHIKTLGLRGKQNFTQPRVPRFQPSYLVDDDLTLNSHAQTVASRARG